MRFKKNPKIKQLTCTTSNNLLFVFGTDKRGALYIWNAIQLQWQPHQVTVDGVPPPTEATE